VFTSTDGTPAVEADNTDDGDGLDGTSSGSGVGVSGTSGSGTGVTGSSTSGDGVDGTSSGSGVGVSGTSDSGAGVSGFSTSADGVDGTANGSGAGVSGFSAVGDGVDGTSAGIGAGVSGLSAFGDGVDGLSIAEEGNGVAGECDTDSNSFGVWGLSAAGFGVYADGTVAGVYGEAFSTGPGVWGQSDDANQPGVEGNNFGTGPAVLGSNTGGGIGVRGETSSGPNGAPAVAGINSVAGGSGVVGYVNGAGSIGSGGTTDSGNGVYGAATSSGNGVLGYSVSGNAIWGAAGGASAYSGLFTGGKGLIVYGPFTVVGGPKAAAVKAADGTLRRLYCVESPESWFEDFGSGQLNNGSTTIQLEPGFAGVVKTDAYHVFLTPQGEPKGPLYVSNKTSSGFAVHEANGGTSNVAFDYRIVAKRKDIAGARLELVGEPAAAGSTPTVLQALQAPALPKRTKHLKPAKGAIKRIKPAKPHPTKPHHGGKHS
jgi:hypothetical protein